MRLSIKQIVFILVCIFFFLSVIVSTSFSVTQNLRVSFLDVGQGDAILVQTPNGKTMLIDGGPRGSLLTPLKIVAPDITHIDVFMLTNPDADHFAGLVDIISRYSIGVVIESGTHSTTKTYKTFDTYIRDNHINRVTAHKDMRIVLDEKRDIYFSVLFPDRGVSGWSRNDGSIVGQLVYGSRKFMFTGDATALTESIVRFRNNQELIQSDVLKVGHHGSKTSTSAAWLEAVSPIYSVVSYGIGNKYGHPYPSIVERIKDKNSILLETAKSGTITCVTDGVDLQCEGER